MTSPQFFLGVKAGSDAYRLGGGHCVPSQHPQGHTKEGRDWFLGCCRGLEEMHRAMGDDKDLVPAPGLATKPVGYKHSGGAGTPIFGKTPKSFNGAAYIRENVNHG